MTNKMTNNEKILLFCAFRYALGRATYVVSTVVQELHARWCELSLDEKEQYVSEILERIENFESLGHTCDYKEWFSIVNRYQDERKELIKQVVEENEDILKELRDE